MSSFASGEELESETDLLSRHKKERRELDGKARALMKTAKKSNKRDIDDEIAKLEAEMNARHVAELSELRQKMAATTTTPSSIDRNGNDNDDDDAGAVTRNKSSACLTEEEKVAAKIAKAKQKKEKKGQKDLEHQLELESQRARRGPTRREIELEALNKMLAPEDLAVKEMAADGSCLYHAVSDQLSTMGLNYSMAEVRKVAAEYMLKNRDEFAPFLGFEPRGSEYEDYCSRVESCTLGEWGGELELKALANGLNKTIIVYSAEAPLLTMRSDADVIGGGGAKHSLRLVFHRHFLTSGEHYNSVQSI